MKSSSQHKVPAKYIDRVISGAILLAIFLLVISYATHEANATARVPEPMIKPRCADGPLPPHICRLVYRVAPRACYQGKCASRTWARSRDLAYILRRESGFDFCAVNPGRHHCSYRGTGSACGLFQRLPCNPHVFRSRSEQIRDGLRYIVGRYGSPSNAQAFWLRHHWY